MFVLVSYYLIDQDDDGIRSEEEGIHWGAYVGMVASLLNGLGVLLSYLCSTGLMFSAGTSRRLNLFTGFGSIVIQLLIASVGALVTADGANMLLGVLVPCLLFGAALFGMLWVLLLKHRNHREDSPALGRLSLNQELHLLARSRFLLGVSDTQVLRPCGTMACCKVYVSALATLGLVCLLEYWCLFRVLSVINIYSVSTLEGLVLFLTGIKATIFAGTILVTMREGQLCSFCQIRLCMKQCLPALFAGTDSLSDKAIQLDCHDVRRAHPLEVHS